MVATAESVTFGLFGLERGAVLCQRYRIQGRLGGGGMGDVYLAHDPVLGRDVAIKSIRYDAALSAEEKEQFVDRFRHEARANAQLSHSAIVQIHDVCEEQQALFIVMQYFSGGRPLLAWGQERKPTHDQWFSVFDHLFAALGHAHRQGILHRDIKSDNVLVRGPSDRPEVLVIDWGIALDQSLSRLTGQGDVVGTQGTVDPEVLIGGPWSQQSDFFFGRCPALPGALWQRSARHRSQHAAEPGAGQDH